MLLVKTVYLGGIEHDGIILTNIVASSRQQLVYDLNVWFFDYFRATNKDIIELPPLDDWKRSIEDHTLWSVKFPDDNWLVWTRSTPIEFR